MAFKHYTFYLSRTPVFPIQFTSKILNFDSILKNEMFDIALFYSNYNIWRLKKQYNDASNKKLICTIAKYWLRMCYRPTPYGLFAGFSFKSISLNGKNINKEERIKLFIEPDCNVLDNLINKVMIDIKLRTKLRYSLNPTFYRFATTYRYYIFVSNQENSPLYSICSLECNLYLDYLYQHSETNYTYDELLSQIFLKLPNLSASKAIKLLHHYINSKILICELFSNQDTDLVLNKLDDLLIDDSDSKNAIKYLKYYSDITNLDQLKVAYRIESNATSPYDKPPLVNISTIYDTSNSLREQPVNLILNQIYSLINLFDYRDKPSLIKFINTFLDIYDTEFVPLLVVLDPEIGIGYDNNIEILKNKQFVDLIFGRNIKSNLYYSNDHLVVMLKNIIDNNLNSITVELPSSILNNVESHARIPTRGAILGDFIELSKDKPLDFLFYFKEFIPFNSFNLISRFLNGDAGVSELVKRNIENGSQTTLYSEIDFIPFVKSWNVTKCKSKYKYSLPINTYINNPNTILLKNILVGIKNNCITLVDKKLNKVIIPRLMNAYNYSGLPLSIYKFLGDLQNSSNFSMSSLLDEILNSRNYLPRLTFKNIILSKRKWKISLVLLDIRPNDINLRKKIKMYFVMNNIPNRIVLHDLYSELFLDLGSDICIDIFITKIIKYKAVIISEDIFSVFVPNVCHETSKTFVNEIIIPVKT